MIADRRAVGQEAREPPLRHTIIAALMAGALGTLIGYGGEKLFDRGPPAAEPAQPPPPDAIRAAGQSARQEASIPPKEAEVLLVEPEPAPFIIPPPPTPAPAPVSAPAAAPRAKATPPEPRPASRPERRAETAARPSFNCRYARTATEKMVCSDAGLARADRRLHAVFEDAMASSRDPRRLRREQDRWLAQRERLAGDEDAVLEHYERRIAELTTD